MVTRRGVLACRTALAGAAMLAARRARAADVPGVTASTVKLGQTIPYSGPASAYGTIGRSQERRRAS